MNTFQGKYLVTPAGLYELLVPQHDVDEAFRLKFGDLQYHRSSLILLLCFCYR